MHDTPEGSGAQSVDRDEGLCLENRKGPELDTLRSQAE